MDGWDLSFKELVDFGIFQQLSTVETSHFGATFFRVGCPRPVSPRLCLTVPQDSDEEVEEDGEGGNLHWIGLIGCANG